MNPVIAFFVVVGCIVLAIAGIGIAGSAQQIDPSEESINMVQPCTLPWCSADTNQQYAEHVNVPNSESNRNNGEANLYNAQATLTVSQAEQMELQNKAHELKDDLMGGTVMVILVIVAVLFFGYFGLMGIGALAKGVGGDSSAPGGTPWHE